MAPVRDAQRDSTSHTGPIALAATSMVGAAATLHTSPVPEVSIIVFVAATVMLALHLSMRLVALAASAAIVAAWTCAVTLLSASATEALWEASMTAAAAGMSVAFVRSVRPGRPAHTPAGPGPVQSDPAERILLRLARQSFSETDRSEMEATLESLIEALDCDSITVWRNTEDGLLAGEVVCSAGATRVDRIVWSRAPSVASQFSTGRAHVFADVESLAHPDRAAYRRMGVEAGIEAPVLVNDRWVGHVSMASHSGARFWEDHEIDAVAAVGEMVSSVWTRRANVEQMSQVVAQRDRSLGIQRALGEAARLIFESDDDQLDRILELILTSLEGRIAYFMTVRHHEVHGDGLIPTESRVAKGTVVPPHLETGNMISVPSHYRPVLAGEPLMISDRDRLDEVTQAWYTDVLPQTVAELVFPVVSGEDVVGVLGITSNRIRSWDAAEIRTVAAIAQMLGVARTRAEARRGLEDIVKAKDSFIASVSHQLRTPMAVVMGLSAELSARWSDFGEDEIMEFIDLISRESREVSHIIEDLLIAARASADSITVLPEVVRLDESVTEAIHTMSAEATHRLVSVELSPVSTMADPLRIRQIVRNLIVNGHRHGGRQIFIRVGEREGRAFVEVSDDGAGIPLERRDRIFEAYEVGESEGWSATMGLGLTVSRQLARLMGGDVTYVHDPMPTFRLTLPVGAARTDIEVPAFRDGAARLPA